MDSPEVACSLLPRSFAMPAGAPPSGVIRSARGSALMLRLHSAQLPWQPTTLAFQRDPARPTQRQTARGKDRTRPRHPRTRSLLFLRGDTGELDTQTARSRLAPRGSRPAPITGPHLTRRDACVRTFSPSNTEKAHHLANRSLRSSYGTKSSRRRQSQAKSAVHAELRRPVKLITLGNPCKPISPGPRLCPVAPTARVLKKSIRFSLTAHLVWPSPAETGRGVTLNSKSDAR